MMSGLGLWMELSGRVVAEHEWCLGSVPSTTRNKVSVRRHYVVSYFYAT